MPYQLHVYLTDTHLVGEWRSEKLSVRYYAVYEKKHWITHEIWGGHIRHNIIFRWVHNDERELIADEYVTDKYNLMQRRNQNWKTIDWKNR